MRIQMSGAEWFGTRPGGLNRYFESLFLALREQPGVEVDAHAFGEPPLGGHSWGQGGPPLDRHWTSRLRTPDATLAAATVVDRHFAAYGPGVPVHSAVPFVLHFQGPWYAESRVAGQPFLKVLAKRLVETLRYARADHAVVLSPEFADLLHGSFGFPAGRISVIPPGVDLERFTWGPPSTEGRTVLCVRRLERRMGIDVLLDAWPEVSRQVPDARLVVVGDGTEREVLEAQAAALGPRAGVTFAGRVDDDSLHEHYQRASLTVVPSRTLEGFGLIALESLASGRAPVVTDVGGLPDSVAGLDLSLVVPPEDPASLADRIVSGLRGDLPDPEACRQHAERFAWRDVAARHVELYRSLGG